MLPVSLELGGERLSVPGNQVVDGRGTTSLVSLGWGGESNGGVGHGSDVQLRCEPDPTAISHEKSTVTLTER